MTTGIPPVILPAACLPDVDFFCWLYHAPEALIEIHETWPKQTCRNRYRIATANGLLTLSIPVVKTDGNHTPISRIKLSHAENWNRIHWRAVASAYNNSPFFLYYKDDFEQIFFNPPELLIDFNLALLKLCCKFAGLKPEFSLTESYQRNPFTILDLRQSIMSKQPVRQEFSISHFEPYIQVFSDRHEFVPNLSILDLLFNLGPEAGDYLKRHVPGS
jgi:hypothetical protein